MIALLLVLWIRLRRCRVVGCRWRRRQRVRGGSWRRRHWTENSKYN